MRTQTAKPVSHYFPLRFSLRTLLILMLLAGPAAAWGWTKWQAYQEARRQAMAREADMKLQIQRETFARSLAAVTTKYGRGRPRITPELREMIIRANEESVRESESDKD